VLRLDRAGEKRESWCLFKTASSLIEVQSRN
jgi:hypothetical protein